MTEHKISWLNMPGYKPETWNPIVGCSKVSPGCDNCYAEKMAFRLLHMPFTDYYAFVMDDNRKGDPEEFRYIPKWNGKTHLVKQALKKPLSWKEPRMIFVCSMGDLFHESVSTMMLQLIFDRISRYRQHIFIILTKRPENIAIKIKQIGWGLPLPPNVWLGVTAENQEQANKRSPILLQIPAAKHFVSIEPLLGPITFRWFGLSKEWYDKKIDADKEVGEYDAFKLLDWVICGGETGPKARPMHPDWVRSLRDQCKAAGTPFFFKQWGEWMDFQEATSLDNTIIPGQRIISAKMDRFPDKTEVIKVGRKYTGNLLDGQQHHNWPGSINLPTKSIHQ